MHTRKHIRDFRQSPLMRKQDSSGKMRNPCKVAIEAFKKINETHRPKPLPKEVLIELDQIINAAEREKERIC